MDESYMMLYLINSLIISIICSAMCGIITSVINKKKGYDGGFCWGFFLGVIGIFIVVMRNDKKDNDVMDREEVARENRKFLNEHDGWECPCCNRLHGLFETRCTCGFSLNEETVNEEEKKNKDASIKAAQSEAELITKYKDMLDNGLISEEEFSEKKKKILGI